MHYFALGFVNIPEVQEDKEKDIETKKETGEAGGRKRSGKGNIMTDFKNEKYSPIQTAFGRSVDDAVLNIMYPYWKGMEEPRYLEFYDQTEEFHETYEEGSGDFILLPNGSVSMLQGYPLYGMFAIKDGKVYEASNRTGGHMKRTKRAKRMKAMSCCPYKKAYRSFKKFAERMCGASYDAETQGYGYYYNPNGIWGSYSIGGRWSHVFLVEECCMEYCTCRIGNLFESKMLEAPEGYKWASAARKKDIAWDVMRAWNIQKMKESFYKYEQMFREGKMEADYPGRIVPNGIMRFGNLYYRKGSTLDEFIEEHFAPKDWRYPIEMNDIIDDGQWVSCEDTIDGFQRWNDYAGDRIDKADDDTVFVVLDYRS